MKAELIAHFCLTYPAYRTANPGMLCKPTKVAAANCQALLPESSHLGDGTSINSISRLYLRLNLTTTGAQSGGRMSGAGEVVEARAMPLTGLRSEPAVGPAHFL